MIPSWRRGLLGLLAVTGAAPLAPAGIPPPFAVGTGGGAWQVQPLQRPAAPGIGFELTVLHVGAADRLIVLSATPGEARGASLGAFGRRIAAAFTDYRCEQLNEAAASRIGYRGLEQRFELTSEKNTLACELFLFADGPNWWAVLYARPKAAPDGAEPAFALLTRGPPAGVVALEPFRVRDVPVSGFPIGFAVERDAASGRVLRVVVNEVPPNSETEQAGVKVGDAITAIDGRAAADFGPGVGKDSELGRVFLTRDLGAQVTLTIAPRAGTPFKLTLRVRAGPDFFGDFRFRGDR